MIKPILPGILLFLFPLLLTAAEKNKGELSNLVCFLRFSDEENNESFTRPFTSYEQLFNNEASGANSVYNYFLEASYRQLRWKSSFFPQPDDNQIISFRTQNPRGYYREQSSINSIGYTDEISKAAREQALIKELAGYLSENLPDHFSIDSNNDGIVDNICIVISGHSDISSKKLLWPHRSDLALPDEKAIYIKEKKVVGYLMVFDDANTGVLCHEMSHTLGTYDLYHTNDRLNPVGVWDLMSDNLAIPQHMSAYTKFKYGKWVDEIPEISQPGTYTLNPVGGNTKEKIAYKIRPIGSDEYFIVEYRKKEGTFDVGLPASGLLVYRINPLFSGGNATYNGTTRLDEVYIFRPEGSTETDGNLSQAAFSAESGRTALGGNAAFKPFYSNGAVAPLALANISSCGETLSFDLLEQAPLIYLSQPNLLLGGSENSSMQLNVESNVDWQVASIPEWLTVLPTQGIAGKSTLTIRTNSANSEAQLRKAIVLFTSVTLSSVTASLNVSQSSNLIQPPSGLHAQPENGTVLLTWVAPQEGSPVLADDFEDTGNPSGWTIRNEGDRGWRWRMADKYSEAHSGNYAMRMVEAWEDLHQDEYLISPIFSRGKTLSFYSKSTAPLKTNPNNLYYVEVSQDGGKTWTAIWDLKTDCPVANQYIRVDIDLTPHLSDQMQIAFHAYDTNQSGLSYWWLVDDVVVYPDVEHSMITGYEIYRNGIKIGTSTTCSFTDYAPLEGINTYSIRAIGTFGVTPDSNTATFSYTGTGIKQIEPAEVEVSVRVIQKTLYLESRHIINRIRLFDTTGKMRLSNIPESKLHEASVAHLPSGVYILQTQMENIPYPVVSKLIIQ